MNTVSLMMGTLVLVLSTNTLACDLSKHRSGGGGGAPVAQQMIIQNLSDESPEEYADEEEPVPQARHQAPQIRQQMQQRMEMQRRSRELTLNFDQ